MDKYYRDKKMLKTTDKKQLSKKYTDFEAVTESIYWEFNERYYKNISEFLVDLKEYMKKVEKELISVDLHSVILEETEILISYEAWINNISNLHVNEVIESKSDENLLEFGKQKGIWTRILAHITSESKQGFTLQELLLKIQNQMFNKQLGDYFFFNKLIYMSDENKIYNFIKDKNKIPLFYVICDMH